MRAHFFVRIPSPHLQGWLLAPTLHTVGGARACMLATCSLYDASLVLWLHRGPGEFCRGPSPTGTLIVSCSRAQSLPGSLSETSPGHVPPQGTHTKKRTGLSVPENPLPNTILSLKKERKKREKKADTQRSAQYVTVYACHSTGMDGGRKEQQCPREWAQNDVCHIHRRRHESSQREVCLQILYHYPLPTQ